jgi:tetratricopeptide (TPR) repeat protein
VLLRDRSSNYLKCGDSTVGAIKEAIFINLQMGTCQRGPEMKKTKSAGVPQTEKPKMRQLTSLFNTSVNVPSKDLKDSKDEEPTR